MRAACHRGYAAELKPHTCTQTHRTHPQVPSCAYISRHCCLHFAIKIKILLILKKKSVASAEDCTNTCRVCMLYVHIDTYTYTYTFKQVHMHAAMSSCVHLLSLGGHNPRSFRENIFFFSSYAAYISSGN